MTTRTYSDGTPAVTYIYDASGVLYSKGRLTQVTSSISTYDYLEYDQLGRVKQSKQTTVGGAAQGYTFSNYSYNLAGEMTSETYPSGRVVATEYDSAGRVAGVRNQGAPSYYAGAAASDATNRIQYAAQGAVSVVKLGNGKWEHTNFNSRLQPSQIGLGTSATNSSILQLDYGYGATNSNNGNVLSQTITIGVTVMTQSYGYDALNRLSSASEGPAWSQTYDCDGYGNRAVRVGSYIPTPALTPQSTSPTDFSAFNQSTNRIALGGFGYDAAGNLTADPTTAANAMVYDAENRQISYTKAGVTTTYTYDGDGKRVKKVDSTGTIIFVYNLGGQLIAEYHSDPVPPPAGGGGTSYLTTDHLGSTRLVTKSDGTVKARYDYLPFGEELGAGVGQRTTAMGYSAADSTKQKFTQKERDIESGLDYFGARYYSSPQGRFTSVDPLLASGQVEDPQSWNRYAYAFNNPLKYIDPVGLWNWDASAGGSFTDDQLRTRQSDNSLSKDERKTAKRQLKFRENFRSAREAAAQAETNSNLTQEQQTRVQQSAAAYGSENDSNGVNVGVRGNVRGSAATTLVNEDDTITVTFNEGLKGDKLAVVSTHEGRHVADGMAWLATHLTGGPTDLNHWEREWNGWFVSSYVAQGLGLKKYGPDGGGSEYQVWNTGWKEADRSINRLAGVARILQYSSLNRTDTDTYSREHRHRP